MQTRAVFFASALASVTLAVACSGANETELFGEPASATLGNEPAPPTGTPPAATADAGSATTTSSSGGSSASGSGSSSGGSSSSGSSSGGSSGGSSSSGSSSGGSSSGGYKSPGVACGMTPAGMDQYCGAGTICCANALGYSCQPAGQPCIGGLTLACDDQTDCPGGQVCCGRWSQAAGYKNVSCQKTCKNDPGTVAVRFCDVNAPKDECAGAGLTCLPSLSLENYFICR